MITYENNHDEASGNVGGEGGALAYEMVVSSGNHIPVEEQNKTLR